MKPLTLVSTLVLVLAFLMTSCGGGGGGGDVGGGSGTGGITYSGVTTQASLTAANANKIFSIVWNGGPSTGSIPSSPNIPQPVQYISSKSVGIVPLAKSMAKKTLVTAAAFNGSTKNVNRSIPINETQSGSVSGTLTMIGSIDDATGLGSMTAFFVNFNDGDGYTHDGNVQLQINGFDMVAGVMTDVTLSFTLWTIKSVRGDFSFTGSMRMQESLQNMKEILTINMDGRENIGKETLRFTNFSLTTVYDNRFYPASVSETVSGQVYTEKFGYVLINTISPCIYSDPNANPSSGGPIILTGAGNSKAFITPFSYGVKIEIDDNGDASTDAITRYFWDNLSGPAFTSLTVVPAASSVPLGLTQHFTATGTFSDSSTKDLTSTVTWTSSNPIVEISSKERSYSWCWDFGCAMGGDLGSSTITATLGDIFGSAAMEVTPAVIVSLDVHPLNSSEPSSMAIGMTRQYEALGTFSSGYRGDASSSATWNSSNNAVASVSNVPGSQGMVRSISSGTTMITATSGGVSASTTLTVTAWTLLNSVTSSDLNRVVWGGSQFVAVGANGTILTSIDGKAFQQRNSGLSSTLYDVAKSGNTFVAVGADGTILASPDGGAWTPQASGTYNNLHGVIWSGSKFVAVGAYGTLLTSVNGTAWTPQVSGTTNSLHGVTWSGSKFVVVGDLGAILTSPDGITWTLHTSQNLNSLGRVAWSGSNYVATSGFPMIDGYLYPYPIHISSDGVNWSKAMIVPSSTDPPSFVWRATDVVWCGTQFVVVGADGYIFTSRDGVNWASWDSGTSSSFVTASCSAAQYVVAGKGGRIMAFP